MKICKDCRISKGLEEFHKSLTNGDRKRSYCKSCSVLRAARRRKNHPYDKMRLRYGVTEEDYNRMLTQQGGVCKICKALPGSKNGFLCIDHKGKKVRGLLCKWCNSALGQFKDNIESLRKAIVYLEESE